jgi:hypothetical protein
VAIFPERRTTRSLLINVVLGPKVLVAVGEPIDVRAMASGEKVGSSQVRQLSDHVMGQIVELLEILREEAAPDPNGVAASEVQDPSRSRW